MDFSKSVNEARSKMDVAQSELDIYLRRHNTAVSQLGKAKEALMAASETLKERKAGIGDIEAKLPQTEHELKEVNLYFCVSHEHCLSTLVLFIFIHIYMFFFNLNIWCD